MEKQEKTLWEEFNLAENNPDPGGGVAYCLKYDEDRISAHRESVITALKEIGVKMEELGEDIAVVPPHQFDDSEQQKLLLLLEELSCLNEACEYIDAGLTNVKSVFELKSILISSYSELLKENNLADAYNLVDMFITQLVHDLTIAHEQNKILTNTDLKELEELADFAEREVKKLNNPHGFVVMGLR